ncbi:MAG: peptide transporter permease [Sphingobacterium sp.]|nr:peptide transporter permease [Sphingobacterium sp.]
MFLAWNEMKSAKLRFLLIIGVLTLMTYLVFLLSGLANGLAEMNREAVDQWKADAIVLTDESDMNLSQSSMTIQDAQSILAKHKAEVAQIFAVARKAGTKIKESVAITGIQKDQFLMPKVSDGRAFSSDHEIVADDSLKADGLKLGDHLTISSSEQRLVIVGFTKKAKFNAAPVLYTTIATVQNIKYGKTETNGKDLINGVVLRDPHFTKIKVPSRLQLTPIESFIEHMPGYTPQKISLDFMIYFLFVIVSVTIGIFLYVLTIQKVSIFGVMKAQGISSLFLIRSVIAQTFLLALFGVCAGFVLTAVTGAFLPSAVPIQLDIPALISYGVIFIFVAALGSLFSVQTIVKIDPVQAIGG